VCKANWIDTHGKIIVCICKPIINTRENEPVSELCLRVGGASATNTTLLPAREPLCREALSPKPSSQTPLGLVAQSSPLLLVAEQLARVWAPHCTPHWGQATVAKWADW